MNWKLYKRDDPNTYPEFSCLVFIYFSEDNNWTARWDNDRKGFIDSESLMFFTAEEFYYSVIGRVPAGYDAIPVNKCNYCNGEYACPYGLDDDGYCMNDEWECEHVKNVNEYVIRTKSTIY